MIDYASHYRSLDDAGKLEKSKGLTVPKGGCSGEYFKKVYIDYRMFRKDPLMFNNLFNMPTQTAPTLFDLIKGWFR